MIHSKVMVIDDSFLRIGSANINNRSMGADTECDLAIEAKSRAERRVIVEIRNRLIGEHCGVTAADVAHALKRQRGSLIAVADTLAANGHSLRPIDDGELDDGELRRLRGRDCRSQATVSVFETRAQPDRPPPPGSRGLARSLLPLP